MGITYICSYKHRCIEVIRTDTVGKPVSEPSRHRRYEHEHGAFVMVIAFCRRTLYRP